MAEGLPLPCQMIAQTAELGGLTGTVRSFQNNELSLHAASFPFFRREPLSSARIQ